MATGLNTELISISKHYKFNFRITLLLLAMLIISNYLLIPKIDVFGAAWGMAISLFLFNIAKTIFLNKKFEIKTITPNTLKVLLAGLIAGICGYFLPVIGNWFTDAIVRSCIIFIVYGLMIFYLKPSADLQVFVQGLYSKITKRNG
jgi:O-antigen/teichoic acid export membrane protein